MTVPPTMPQTVLLAALGAVAGLLVAGVVVAALHRSSVAWPLGPACPRCVEPGRGAGRRASVLPRVRCPGCGWPLGSRFPLVELATAAVFAALVWRVGLTAAGPAYLYLGGLAVALGAVDLATHRLPDVLTLPAYPALAALLAVASAILGDGDALLRAGLGALACFGAYYLVAVLAPDAMGFGDVKLAGVLGLALGWAGWPVLVAGVFLGFLFGGVVALGLVAVRRATRRTRIPFGPFMLAGALTALALSERMLVHPLTSG